jgi:hypothetical protein
MEKNGVEKALREVARATSLALCAALLMIGCGSSDSKKSAAPTNAPAATHADVPGVTTPAATGDASGGSIKLPVQDGSYQSGRVHAEFGGDSGGAVEVDGTGVVVGGYANLTFVDTNSQVSIVFGIGGGQPGAAVFTWDGITSGGEFGKECTISFTKGDQTALEGNFSCTGMNGVKANSTDILHVDAHGTFKLGANP